MTFIEKLRCIERVDQLIRLRATGSPTELANRLNISKRSVHNLLEDMRNMGASIYYCHRQRSYCYELEMQFVFGFQDGKGKQIFGGMKATFFLNLFKDKTKYVSM
jgi:hypothetical protein